MKAASVFACGVTLCGLGLGLFGVVTRNPWLLGASLLLDAVDGAVARALHACSVFGSFLDWTTDCFLCSYALTVAGLVWLVPFAVAWQAFARSRDLHVSGRLLAFVVLAVA